MRIGAQIQALPRPRGLKVPAILHLDEAVLVIDKPAGIAVHAGPRGGVSLDDIWPALRLGKRRDPRPAHRLDTDTAGCLALGRTSPALAQLGTLFAARRVEKTYWAAVAGEPPDDSGTIDAPLLKHSTARDGWRMIVHRTGQPALTQWRVLGRAPRSTWLELTPCTGRTHQLRAHCAHAGWPILGDIRYGGGPAPMQLLARAIAIPLDPPVTATAPVPPHMRVALAACGWMP